MLYGAAKLRAELDRPQAILGQAPAMPAGLRKTPKLVEIPLNQAIISMQESPQWCTLGPCASEVWQCL